MTAGVINATPPGGRRGSIGVVLVLDVRVALDDPEPLEADNDAEDVIVDLEFELVFDPVVVSALLWVADSDGDSVIDVL
jgi:hypothetical protein